MEKSIINQRFIKAFNFLYDSKRIKKKSKFAYDIGVSPQILSEILGERMNVNLNAIQFICKEYNVNYDYIFEGQGSIIHKQYTQSDNPIIVEEPEIAAYSDKETLLLKMLKEKEQRIEDLNIRIGKQHNIIENLKNDVKPAK